jgi:RNA recognition motif-containing protein
MSNEAEANAAIQALNGVELMERTIKVNEARPREERGGGGGGGRGRW